VAAGIIVGCLLLVAALAVVVGLTVWSRQIIERIAARKLRSAREIVRELNHG